ncbi:CG11912 [Drosophila busckii]|uniref:CG11912 n=1 Tax=Drosophila busckii TaxID=30019 RepID=A0A0M5J3I1_DROBS|nr:lectizyme [Drosophila busckii]ALC38506.1 CG11912 [Drosophila busckii]
MRAFVVLLALVVATASGNIIGLPGFPEGRIINGHEAESGEAPFIVSLQNVRRSHFCAGSVYKSNCVITAAHCLTSDEYLVVAGAHSRSDKDNVQVRTASSKRHRIHENYGGGVGPYDIGVILLDEPLNLTTLNRDGSSPVSSIDIANEEFTENTNGTLYGWGLDNFGYLPDKLQKLDVNIIGYEDCDKALPWGNNLAESNICTFTQGTTDGACNGDSGGPLVNKRADGRVQQVGVVSWGYTPCASTRYPSVYTYLGAFSDWIEKHCNNN